MTRTLEDLAGTPEGRTFLDDRMALSPDAFVERLRPPVDGALREALELGGEALPVYVGQQLMADYPPSVVAKFRTAAALGDDSPVSPFLLWLDTDGAGSSKEITTIHVTGGKAGALHVRLSSRRHDSAEIRFVPVEGETLQSVAHHLRAWGRQNGRAVHERAERLADRLMATGGTLADRNLAVTSFVVREVLGVWPPAVLVSDLARRSLLTATLNEVVAAIDDVIVVFNEAVGSLETADVDPHVQRLTDDYLPLNYSCDVDDRRCRLVRAREGGDTYAVARCRGGHDYRFRLGGGVLSLDELEATGRWSPDVTLPICLNDLVSGVVVGRSSALYGLILNEVLIKVLGRAPVPMFLPPGFLDPQPADPNLTLVGEYLLGP